MPNQRAFFGPRVFVLMSSDSWKIDVHRTDVQRESRGRKTNARPRRSDGGAGGMKEERRREREREGSRRRKKRQETEKDGREWRTREERLVSSSARD